MKRTKFIYKNIVFALIVLLLCIVVTAIFSTQFIGQAYAYERLNYELQYNDTIVRGGYTIDDIRTMLRGDDTLYRDFRVFSDTEGTKTYKIPVLDYEREQLLSEIEENRSESFNTTQRNFTWPHQVIMGQNRRHDNSIVIVLMGDAFTAAQYVDANGREGIAIQHAHDKRR